MGIDMKYSGDCDADYINMNIYLADRNRFKFRVLNGDEEMQERYQSWRHAPVLAAK